MHINQKRKTTSHLLFDEIICAIVFGSIPCLLVLQFSGVEGLVSFFEGITPPDYLIYYFLLLTILHSVVWAISKYSLSLSDSTRTFKYRLHALSYAEPPGGDPFPHARAPDEIVTRAGLPSSRVLPQIGRAHV